MKTKQKGFTAVELVIAVFGLLAWITVVGLVIWVAVHFISKLW